LKVDETFKKRNKKTRNKKRETLKNRETDEYSGAAKEATFNQICMKQNEMKRNRKV
jgi:hypothetical protein